MVALGTLPFGFGFLIGPSERSEFKYLLYNKEESVEVQTYFPILRSYCSEKLWIWLHLELNDPSPLSLSLERLGFKE